MELLDKLFFTHGAAQAVIVLSLTIVFGILLGRIKIFSVSFGIGGILFSGIILGHFGFSLDPKVLVFTREFGLILFVFAIGMAVGPTFLESLRDQGLKLNMMAVFIVLFGGLLGVICYSLFDLTIPQTVGMYSGAVTNTPGMGAANEAWSQVAGSPDAVASGLQMIGMAYAVAYPFGIFGIILTMMILKGIFHINVAEELKQVAAKHPEHHLSIDSAGRKIVEILVSNPKAVGKYLSNLASPNVQILAVRRGAEEYAWDGDWRPRLEDVVIAVDSYAASGLAKKLGNDRKALSHPQMLSIFAGIFIGVLAGCIPVAVPGLPTGVKLGVAGGSLLAGIFFSRVQRCWGLTFYMTSGAMQLMREIGILLFMACVGLYAGTGFVETVVHGPGLQWMGMGAIITFFPLLTAALICRACWGIDFPSICGMLAGSMTDPPALAFAMQYYGGEVAASGYSQVYPLTMILRILMGQLLVLLLAAAM